MLTIFSAFDERARPKGSRDPLGAEATWSYMGRRLVGNLTTVTASLDNFIVAMLCCEFANSGESGADIQERYLRCEQMGAYLRLARPEGNTGLLGVSRARSNFEAASVRLGKGDDAQILADQASYGLWGLYSSALESVGLIDGERRRPTPAGRALLSHVMASFGAGNWETLARMAVRDRVATADIRNLAPGFDAMLRNAALRKLTVEALLSRQKDCALQSELFTLATSYLDAGTDQGIRPFCDYVLGHPGTSREMRTVMTQIRDIDPVLRRADLVMAWLQSRDETSLDELAELLAPCLAGIRAGESWHDVPALPHRAFLKTFHDACVAGAASEVIRAVLAQNKQVMALRGGAAWVDSDASRRLVVRVRNDRSNELEQLGKDDGSWHHSYFLASFLAIASQGRP